MTAQVVRDSESSEGTCARCLTTIMKNTERLFALAGVVGRGKTKTPHTKVLNGPPRPRCRILHIMPQHLMTAYAEYLVVTTA